MNLEKLVKKDNKIQRFCIAIALIISLTIGLYIYFSLIKLVISSITKYKLTELKDELWKLINKEYV